MSHFWPNLVGLVKKKKMRMKKKKVMRMKNKSPVNALGQGSCATFSKVEPWCSPSSDTWLPEVPGCPSTPTAAPTPPRWKCGLRWRAFC